MSEQQKQTWSNESRAGAALRRTFQRSWDLDVGPRFYFDDLKKVEYKGNKVFRVVYQDNGVLKTDHFATNTMSKAEILLLTHFYGKTIPTTHRTRPTGTQMAQDADDQPTVVSVNLTPAAIAATPVAVDAKPDGIEPKPMLQAKTRLSGIEMLEQKMRSRESPITEAVRSTAMTVPDRKYRTVRVVRKRCITVEEEYLLPFTDMTLNEFLEMQRSSESDAKIAVQYLLKRQCSKIKPEAVRNNSNDDGTFEIRV
jgi:hypothetical protein